MPIKRILIAWFEYTINGGISRFINLAKCLQDHGIDIQFLSLSGQLKTSWPSFPSPILSLEEASAERWDVIMLPGAGAEPAKLAQLSQLQHERFGFRVQHILNDPHFYERFEQANLAFRPQVIIFNNNHWRISDYRNLNAQHFFNVVGGIDQSRFCPPPKKAFRKNGIVRVAGLASNNFRPLLEAFDVLPANFELHAFGRCPDNLTHLWNKLLLTGRAKDYGYLFDQDLLNFYHNVDLVVATDIHAGWCNLAAEAMACGLPCILTRAGTLDFADHLVNSFLIESVNSAEIVEAILRLTEDEQLRTTLSANGPRALSPLSLNNYAKLLIETLQSAM